MGQHPSGSDPAAGPRPAAPVAPSESAGFASLFEHHPDVVYELTRDGVIVGVNGRFEERSGYPPDLVIGGTYHLLIHEDDHPLAEAEFVRAVAGEARTVEVTGTTVDGDPGPYSVTLVPNVAQDGGGHDVVAGVFAIVRDLGPERQVAAERDEVLRQLDEWVATVGSGLAITLPGGHYQRVNPVYCELTGYSQEQLLEMTVHDVVHPDDINVVAELEDGTVDRVRTQKRLLLPNGELRWVRSTLSAIRDADGTPTAYLSASEDISEQKATEAALEDAAWLRREAGRLAGFGAWSVTVPDWEVSWSEEIYEIVGISGTVQPGPAEALAYYVPASRAAVARAVERCGTHGEPFDLEARLVSDHGDVFDVRIVAEARRDADGRIVRVIGTFQDITSLKQATEASQRSAEQLEATLSRISEAVITYDDRWRITYVNPAGERLTERDRDELLGQVVWEVFPELVGTELERYYHQAVDTGQAVYVDRFYFPVRDTWYRLILEPSEKGGLKTYARNISAQVREERRLREMASTEHAAAEELRSLDRMKNAFITAISHELRTPLTVVRGMADTLVRLRDDPDPAVREGVEDALADHAARLSDLLDDLLDTDRLVRGVLHADRRPAELVAMVRAAIDASAVADRVRLTAPDHLDVEVDAVLVERSLRNLLENVGKYAPVGSVEVTVTGSGDGGFVLRVRDHGPGIPAGHTERVFEPFHRVLDHPQPGTGVGLSLVAEFAHLHGGRAYVDSEVVDGTCIVIEVPAAPARSAG